MPEVQMTTFPSGYAVRRLHSMLLPNPSKLLRAGPITAIINVQYDQTRFRSRENADICIWPFAPPASNVLRFCRSRLLPFLDSWVFCRTAALRLAATAITALCTMQWNYSPTTGGIFQCADKKLVSHCFFPCVVHDHSRKEG